MDEVEELAVVAVVHEGSHLFHPRLDCIDCRYRPLGETASTSH